MKRKLNLRKFIIFLVLVLFVAAGSTVRTVSVQAAITALQLLAAEFGIQHKV